MDEIEELCLNELLGISTKRLLSIINATKCPSDTESSSDSDVEHQEGMLEKVNIDLICNSLLLLIAEHISLEEISSDSEIEGTSSNAGKLYTFIFVCNRIYYFSLIMYILKFLWILQQFNKI